MPRGYRLHPLLCKHALAPQVAGCRLGCGVVSSRRGCSIAPALVLSWPRRPPRPLTRRVVGPRPSRLHVCLGRGFALGGGSPPPALRGCVRALSPVWPPARAAWLVPAGAPGWRRFSLLGPAHKPRPPRAGSLLGWGTQRGPPPRPGTESGGL